MLHLPPSRLGDADPAKLQRQIALHGKSLPGMLPILVYRGSDGKLMIADSVTRATGATKLCPEIPVHVEVLGRLPRTFGLLPIVTDKLP